jgi:hypothetical protein
MGENLTATLALADETGFLEKRMRLNCGAERHHDSMFNIGRSMFNVHLSKNPCRHKCNM